MGEFSKRLFKRDLKKFISVIMTIIITFTGMNQLMYVNAATKYITLNFIDNTQEKWIGNDSAVMELVDNTNGHDSYIMTKKDEVTWSVNVPFSADNITFNRYSQDKSAKWNSWSAGGRSVNNTYYADGSEYGYWGIIKEGFHTGDIIYLDISEFTTWENDNALMYINFTDASKEQNSGKDVVIMGSDKSLYNPILTECKSKEYIYKYIVTQEDEGAGALRFWRGNDATLWNCSTVLSYDDYLKGLNCIKVSDWNSSGSVCHYDEEESLSVSRDEILVGRDSATVYFYIDALKSDSNNIVLYENDIAIGQFYDDGDYENHGDDIKGDGIYSAKYTIDINVTDDVTYCYHAESDGQINSNEITIDIIMPFTEKELTDMEYVNNTISAVLSEYAIPDSLCEVLPDFLQNDIGNAKEYKEAAQRKYNALDKILNSLLDEGMISEFYYDDVNRVFNCTHLNGIVFGVFVDDFLKSSSDYNECMEMSETTIEPLQYSGYSALILNMFEDTAYRRKYYENFVKEWLNKGMDVYYDDYVTVDDLKTCLADKDIISLSGHGGVLEDGLSIGLADDIVTETSEIHYVDDLKTKRITYCNLNNQYVFAVTADFFTHYYGNEGLSGSFIFSEACEFLGNSEFGFDHTFADAFISCSAESVIGFHNSVMANYSRELMLYYFEQLLTGITTSEAFNSAKKEYGLNDYEYRKPSFIQYLFDRDAFEKMGAAAVPYMFGNSSAVITKELQNGTWEMNAQRFTQKPLKWKYSGDARVLSKLGEIEPYGKRMVFISTGIGSQSGVSMSGTQGTMLTQTVRNTDKTTLKFSYDVISEEPMEYVNSRFDDKFEVQILDFRDNILYSQVLESVNSSNWNTVSGINFDGGDNTAFHTNWKTVGIDISSYQNQVVKVRFLVYDVGDSAYDTAVVLDNIMWS
ncbi:MAG: hypothetical protein K2I03_10040 [Lachnospiraceae bacterium]|nr:hypothetical protein [Lachnospiraceae bacterium]